MGTEEGFVCLFNITGEGMDYNMVLDSQEGRILSLAWHCDGVHIATGSMNTVRVWNIETGHPTPRMNTGRGEEEQGSLVHCYHKRHDCHLWGHQSQDQLLEREEWNSDGQRTVPQG